MAKFPTTVIKITPGTPITMKIALSDPADFLSFQGVILTHPDSGDLSVTLALAGAGDVSEVDVTELIAFAQAHEKPIDVTLEAVNDCVGTVTLLFVSPGQPDVAVDFESVAKGESYEVLNVKDGAS